MAIQRFVDIASREPTDRDLYRRFDRVEGSRKVKTICGNPSIYSRQSDLDRIISPHFRPINFDK